MIEYRFSSVSVYLFAIAGSNPFSGHIPVLAMERRPISASLLPGRKEPYALHPQP
jgi:hypothetical protein